MLLQTVFADDGVGDERIGREDTCQQHRGQGRIAQQMDAGKVGADEGDEKREQSEDDELQPLLLQVAEVHLQSGQEHDVEQAHLAEEFERGVTLQDVQSVFAHSHTTPAPQLKGQDLIDNFIFNEGGKIQLNVEPDFVPDVQENANEGEKDAEDGYFTETLAKIYIKQGRYSKALEIINRLNLNYPKKNAYFADQIRFLEKLIINNKTNK